MKKAPRVMIGIPVLLIGGTEIQTLSLVQVLICAGYQVSVCCYYEFDPAVVDMFKTAGTEVILLHLDRSDGRFGFSSIRALARRYVTVYGELCRRRLTAYPRTAI